MSEDDGFLARWSRRKALTREGPELPQPAPQAPVTAPPVAAPAQDEGPPAAPADETAAALPPPTLEDVAALGPDADFARFVQPDVDPPVQNAALKKLFADPRFNLTDGLDIDAGDYTQPDPLPASMLRQMVQSRALGLLKDEAPPPAPDTKDAPDEDADLRLQRHDAAGPADAGDAGPGAGEDPGRES